MHCFAKQSVQRCNNPGKPADQTKTNPQLFFLSSPISLFYADQNLYDRAFFFSLSFATILIGNIQLVILYLSLQSCVCVISLFSADTLGGTSNTTLRILSVRGVPPLLYGQNFRQKKGYGFGGYPPPPLYGHSPEKSSLKSAKNGDFCPKNTCFWSKK